jgi:hypothetical protein
MAFGHLRIGAKGRGFAMYIGTLESTEHDYVVGKRTRVKSSRVHDLDVKSGCLLYFVM